MLFIVSWQRDQVLANSRLEPLIQFTKNAYTLSKGCYDVVKKGIMWNSSYSILVFFLILHWIKNPINIGYICK